MNPGELEVLCALVDSVKPTRVVEFGCNMGRTAKVLMREVKSIVSYVGVDVLPGYQFKCQVQKNEIPFNPGGFALDDVRFELVLRDRGTLDLRREDLGTCDVVFIDGDHSYDAVIHDSVLANSIVRPGGMIIWHDYHGQPVVDVRRALEEIAEGGVKIQYVKDTWLAFYCHPNTREGVTHARSVETNGHTGSTSYARQ